MTKRITLVALGLILAWTATARPATAAACDDPYNDFNGPRSFFLNVHNCGTECAQQELPYLELLRDGITGVRINPVTPPGVRPPDPEVFELNPDDPYLTGVLDVFGPQNVLVLIDDGIDQGPHAKPTPRQMERKLRRLFALHPRVRRVEFMNEPLNFSAITPEEYVGRYLPVARQVVDELNRDRAPEERILLYSAAWFGDFGGVRETYRMVSAGGLAWVDAMSAHIYGDKVEEARQLAREYKRLARGKPVAVTETNYHRNDRSSYEAQHWWICQAMTGMESILRRGLDAPGQELQHNVLYTLRGDQDRRFNVIHFPHPGQKLLWRATGPAHFVIVERSQVPTDPKDGDDPGGENDEPGDEPSGDDPGTAPPGRQAGRPGPG